MWIRKIGNWVASSVVRANCPVSVVVRAGVGSFYSRCISVGTHVSSLGFAHVVFSFSCAFLQRLVKVRS
jgi:hypothetical protein